MRGTILLAVMMTLSIYQLRAQTTTVPAIPEEATHSAIALSHYLSQHTHSDQEFLLELYGWITNNVTYDVQNMFRQDYYKDTADAVVKTLQTRTGVCFGYASLYQEVCRQAGIPAYLVTGYTKKEDKIDNVSHAWIVVNADINHLGKTWYMTDPTWGAGGVSQGKFVRHPDNKYFAVLPSAFLRTHMPYDPMWQLLDHPIKQDEFASGDWSKAGSRPYFNYRDSIIAYNHLDELAKYQHTIARIKQSGVTNQFTENQVTYYQNLVNTLSYNREVTVLNAAVDKFNNSSSLYNQVVNLFNKYIQYKNSQFRSVKDKDLQNLVADISEKLSSSRNTLATVGGGDASLQDQVRQLQQIMDQMWQQLQSEQRFVDKYLKTDKADRMSLFMVKRA